jgi:hypothetical protein
MFAGTTWTDEAIATYREMVGSGYLSGTFWRDVHYAIAQTVEANIDASQVSRAEVRESMSITMCWGLLIVQAAKIGDRPTSLDGNRLHAYDYALSLLSSDRNTAELR